VVATGFGGTGTFSSGGVAVVSGAIVVKGLESAREGAGAAATGAVAVGFFFPRQPQVASARPHRQTNIGNRLIMTGLGLPFLFCKRLTEITHFPRWRFQGARERQLQTKRSATADF
jgi:hypothetical protein